ncbi:Mitogen-activated protein kinase kinase kinase 7 [Stylophora pistillata]|uniref:Mitogen-activated protein kinase kinase kinase 7 n=1 Tax=Stylophora pistillata TaxID=50429 RepID=A0A2B4RZ17_STYPI|nr:Mitogen-activated protein kinase kinase kinase 7 [Stylophora pistillata]
MAEKKTKTIDEIDDLMEMFQAMVALGVSCEGLKSPDIEQMRDRVKAELKQSPSTLSWTAGQLGKLLEGVKEKRREGEFPSTCALFVCNKWDQIPGKEAKDVENHVIRQLRKFYPDIVPEKQIVQMSTKKASIAQNHGIITKDFVALMDCMRSMILRGIKARLEIYWRWLYGLLSQIVYNATAHVKNALRNQEKVTKVMAFILLRLTRIDTKQNEVMEHLHNYLECRTSDAVDSLSVYLRSDEVRSHFTSWSLDDVPKAETSWEVTKCIITKVMQSRLQEIIEHWEEDNHVFACTRDSLVQHFRERYNFLEGELRNLQGAVVSDDLVTEVDHPVDAGLTFTTAEKVAIGITSPIWFPLSLVALVISAPVVGVMAIRSKLENRSNILKYEKDKCAFMKEASADYLNDLTNGDVLITFVKEQLKDATICLKQIEARIPELIEADKLLCKQLLKEKRPANEIKEIYEPILDIASEIRGRLAVFGLEEGLSAGIRGDTKVKHPNVVNFHGMSLLKDDGETRVVLVMEYCTGTLKDRIFKNPERAPANSKNADAKRDPCRWIKQITAALTFIHDQKVVHRDLKLDNILLSAGNVAKITDVGVSKAVEHITGTLAGTPVYMAPEVFHSQLYDSKADMYSLGIIFWEMWYGLQAFSEVRNVPIVAFFAMVDKGLRPGHVKGCNQPPRRWEELMQSCWSKKPEKRPSASHCLKEAIELYKEAVPELL